jgi:hypothetical protein
MDGMETLLRLRQKSDLPVIFLTSKDDCGESPPFVTLLRPNLLNLRNAACSLPHCTQRSEAAAPSHAPEPSPHAFDVLELDRTPR